MIVFLYLLLGVLCVCVCVCVFLVIYFYLGPYSSTASGRSAHVVPHTRYAPSTGSTFSGPSLSNRPGKVRTYSHGASTVGATRIEGTIPHHQQQPPSSSSSSSINRRSWTDLSGARSGAGAVGKE